MSSLLSRGLTLGGQFLLVPVLVPPSGPTQGIPVPTLLSSSIQIQDLYLNKNLRQKSLIKNHVIKTKKSTLAPANLLIIIY